LNENPKWTSNYSYFPILIEPNFPLSRDDLYNKLKKNGINSRRYFYPLISNFPMYRSLPSAQHSNLIFAAEASAKVICLPIYPDLEESVILKVVKIIGEI